MSQTGRTPRLLHGCGNTFKFTSNLLSLHCWACTLFAFTVFGHLSYIYISIAASSSYVHQQWHLNFHSSEHSVAKWKHAIQTYEWQFFHWKKSHRIKIIRQGFQIYTVMVPDLACPVWGWTWSCNMEKFKHWVQTLILCSVWIAWQAVVFATFIIWFVEFQSTNVVSNNQDVQEVSGQVVQNVFLNMHLPKLLWQTNVSVWPPALIISLPVSGYRHWALRLQKPVI